jgi:hypothetical protein
MAAHHGLETRKRLRLDGSNAEPTRPGKIAGVFKSDLFFKEEAPSSGVEIDLRMASAVEKCMHEDASLSAAASLLQTSILMSGELELVRGTTAAVITPTDLFHVYLRTWFQPLASEVTSDMVTFGYCLTAIQAQPGAINVPVRLHPLLCPVRVSTKNCRMVLTASGDFDDTISSVRVHTMYPPGIDGSIRSPAAASMDTCSLLATFSSIAVEAARERADPVVLIQARHGPNQASQSSILRNMLWDSESREQLTAERESDAFKDDHLLHQLVTALNHAQTHTNPHTAKKDEEVRGHRVARTQVIPRDSEAANSAPKPEAEGADSILSARLKAEKLYMSSFGLTDAVLGSTGRAGQSTQAIKLFEARISALRNRVEIALTATLQDLFSEYAVSDTRLRFRRSKELVDDGVQQVVAAHEARLLPQDEAQALVHHHLDGVCHQSASEEEEQPAIVDEVVGDEVHSEAGSSRSDVSARARSEAVS